MIEAPVMVTGRLVGSIRGEQLGSARSWSSLERGFARTLADFVALAQGNHLRRETERRLSEAVTLAEGRLATIETQRQAIAVLSAPVIDLWQGVLAVPIVGLIDAEGSVELTERLLARLESSGAHSVIVDLTGIEDVDTMTASHLLRMLRSARLLGARSVLCGLSPRVAQTLVQLDVDLSELGLVRGLEQALQLSLRRT